MSNNFHFFKPATEAVVFPAALNEFGFPEEVELLEKCPTRSSVLALSVTCALLALVYICTVFGVLTKRWMARGNKVV